MPKSLSVVAFAFAAATVLSVPAQAAENPAATWTGFYAGVNAGYGWGQSNTATTFSSDGTIPALKSNPGDVLAASAAKLKMNDVVGGFQTGYNWQAAGFVYGVEADIQRTNQRGSTSFACPVPQLASGCNELIAAGKDGLPPTASFNQHLNWFGTFRGRFGALITPDTLIYGTGGFAFGRIETDGIITGYGVNTVRTTTFSHKAKQSGWTAGGGIESRIIGDWTARLEYLYIDLGTIEGPATGARNFPLLTFAYNSQVTESILRAGLSYKFGF